MPITFPAWPRLLSGTPSRKRLPPVDPLPSRAETQQALDLLGQQGRQQQQTANLLSRVVLQHLPVAGSSRWLPLKVGLWKALQLSNIPGVTEMANGALMHSQPLLYSGIIIAIASRLSSQWGKNKSYARVMTPQDISKALSEPENGNPKSKSSLPDR